VSRSGDLDWVCWWHLLAQFGHGDRELRKGLQLGVMKRLGRSVDLREDLEALAETYEELEELVRVPAELKL
jgi:hypothetical protein